MTIVIAAGGTGGHLYPALAIAEEFHRRDPAAAITFVGTGRAVERIILEHSPFPVERLDVEGIVGRGWRAISAGLRIPRALLRAAVFLRRTRTDLVIGMGGYVSPPVVLAAWLLGIRRAIVEPNAMPGLANRILGPVAQRIFLAFDSAQSYFPRSKTHVVGTPLRKVFVEDTPILPEHLHSLLVCGGSQGARAINDAMVEAVAVSPQLRQSLAIVHQTGIEDHARIQEAYAALGVSVEARPFISDMPSVLRTVDLVVARAGAATLAELAAWGKPAILVPFPQATHQHQERNAREAESAGAAIVIAQSELTGRRLAREIEGLMHDPGRIRRMAACSLARRRTDATEVVVQECQRLVREA